MEWRSDIFICIPRLQRANSWGSAPAAFARRTKIEILIRQTDVRGASCARRRLVKSCFFSESGGKCDTVNFGETFYFTWMCWKFHLYSAVISRFFICLFALAAAGSLLVGERVAFGSWWVYKKSALRRTRAPPRTKKLLFRREMCIYTQWVHNKRRTCERINYLARKIWAIKWSGKQRLSAPWVRWKKLLRPRVQVNFPLRRKITPNSHYNLNVLLL